MWPFYCSNFGKVCDGVRLGGISLNNTRWGRSGRFVGVWSSDRAIPGDQDLFGSNGSGGSFIGTAIRFFKVADSLGEKEAVNLFLQTLSPM